MSEPMAMQMLTRKPDGNGNVPRLLVVYSPAGHIVDLVEIAYGNIPEHYRGVTRLPDMKLSEGEFRSWVHFLKDRKGG